MKNSKITFEQVVALDAKADMRETADGYLIASPRIARTGIQVYRGHELGRPELAEVRVYRPESEVMAKDSLHSLAGKPVTIEHPAEPVTAKNWKDVAVGHLGEEIVRDGEYLRVPLILMDAAAVNEVRSGRKQLSVGYSAVLHWGDGKTEDGEKYDAIQTAIRANHVAITHAARGGDKLRMGDHSHNKERVMAKLKLDSFVIEMEEKDMQIVEKHLGALQKELETARTETATVTKDLATATAASQTKDAEIITLKKQLEDSKLSPKQIQDAAKAWSATLGKATALLGDKLVLTDATDAAALRRQVVMAKLGDTAKNWNDEMVKASFDTIEFIAADSDKGNLSHVVNVLKHADNGGVNNVAKSYQEYEAALTNRWKTAGRAQ